MNTRILFTAIIFLGIGIATTTAQESTNFDPTAATYLWPTKASSHLSSTFGETRSAHFHAALDIKTWGRRGYEVYATRNGTVDRIAIGPRGYGKVVYLKHDDGSYSVYAHLLSFNNQLQQLADSTRFANGYQFEMKKFLNWKKIEVNQGDLIGYSGASGIGPPHLHFELRTPNHRPFNPLLTNLSVTDNIPPQIRDISIEPLSPQSSIEGENNIYTKRAQLNGDTYDFGTVTVDGPIGLGINTFDQANRVHNSYAVYKLKLIVDENKLFSSKVDSFSYHETDQMFIDRVYPLLQKKNKGYQRLYIADGNTLPFYETDSQKGILNLPPGEHKITIETEDFYGNSSTAQLTLQVQKKQNKATQPSYDQKRVTPTKIVHSPNDWNWFSNWVTLSQDQFQHITVGITEQKSLIAHNSGMALDLRHSKQTFMNIPGVGPISFYRLVPEKQTFISSSHQDGFARFPQHTFYDTVSVGMSIENHTADSVSVRILPNAYPIKDEYSFYINRDSALSDTTKLSFYHWDEEDNEWEWVPTSFSEKFIISKTESLGTFVLQRDSTPPKVENPRVRQRPDGKWVILINAIDDLSGIDHNNATITVNNVRGIAEFEPESDRFVYYHPTFSPTDSMKIDISVWDKAGNKSVQRFQLKHSSRK
ncbi:M23 family metallopeptidase [Fodinibius sp. Rm-B-1B1-1]|uniref:M23 family metallopeptidase n=1 Tax=Fodinibius alkaliphilus TaxID=3140241 RepID=UPI00315A092F